MSATPSARILRTQGSSGSRPGLADETFARLRSIARRNAARALPIAGAARQFTKIAAKGTWYSGPGVASWPAQSPVMSWANGSVRCSGTNAPSTTSE